MIIEDSKTHNSQFSSVDMNSPIKEKDIFDLYEKQKKLFDYNRKKTKLQPESELRLLYYLDIECEKYLKFIDIKNQLATKETRAIQYFNTLKKKINDAIDLI